MRVKDTNKTFVIPKNICGLKAISKVVMRYLSRGLGTDLGVQLPTPANSNTARRVY